MQDKTYTCILRLKICVTLSSKISNSPAHIIVWPGDPYAYTTQVLGLTSTGSAGTNYTFVVQLLDYYGNVVDLTLPTVYYVLNATATGPYGANVPTFLWNVLSASNGTFLVSYIPPSSGDFSFDVTLNKTSVQGSPFAVNICKLFSHNIFFF